MKDLITEFVNVINSNKDLDSKGIKATRVQDYPLVKQEMESIRGTTLLFDKSYPISYIILPNRQKLVGDSITIDDITYEIIDVLLDRQDFRYILKRFG